MVSRESVRKEELNYNHARLLNAVRMGSASERLGCEAELGRGRKVWRKAMEENIMNVCTTERDVGIWR